MHHLILVGFFPLVMVSATASAKIAYDYEKFKRFYIIEFIKLVLQILVILVSCQGTCLTLKESRCSYLKKLTEFLITGFQVTLIMEQTNILISNLNAGQQKYLQCRHFLLFWPECHGICSHEEFSFQCIWLTFFYFLHKEEMLTQSHRHGYFKNCVDILKQMYYICLCYHFIPIYFMCSFMCVCVCIM